jgi:hypothetical protein
LKPLRWAEKNYWKSLSTSTPGPQQVSNGYSIVCKNQFEPSKSSNRTGFMYDARPHRTLHTYVNTYALIHMSLYICPHTYVLIHMSSYICPHTYVLIHMSSYICPHTYVLKHMSSYICPHTYVLIHMSSYICPHTYVLTHMSSHMSSDKIPCLKVAIVCSSL